MRLMAVFLDGNSTTGAKANDELRLPDLHPGNPEQVWQGLTALTDEALLAPSEGWSEDLHFGLETGLDIRHVA